MASSTLSTAGRLGTAAAGGIIAGPIGFAVGSLVGSLLFGGGPDVEEPRLDDLDVASSSYGTAIPRGYGLAKITGTVIWATDIVEKKSTEKHGGFFGIGGTKVTTYRYFANLAVAFGEGPATEIPRLWAGDKLLRDRGYYDTSQGVLLGGRIAASPHHLAGLRLRSYPGTEDQEPDPLIRKKVEEETGEADATPAHRGLVYVVLESLPLEDFGNRIPPVTAEVNWGGETQQPIEEVSLLQGQEITGLGSAAAFDWPRMRAFFAGGGGLRRIRLDGMREDLQEADVTTDGSGVTPHCTTRGGDVVCERDTGSNTSAFILVDGDTLKEKSRFGFSSAGLGHTPDRPECHPARSCVGLRRERRAPGSRAARRRDRLDRHHGGELW